MSQTRQTTTILFSDIVGCRVLICNDEQKEFLISYKHRVIQKSDILQFIEQWINISGIAFPFKTQNALQPVTINLEGQAKCHPNITLHLAASHAKIDEKIMRSLRRTIP